MIGIIVLLAVSWLLLYLIEKRSFLALGFLPIDRRLKEFFVGLGVTALLCVLAQSLEALLKNYDWVVNDGITLNLVLEALFWDIKSVFTEELMFRGALLYILIQKIGAKRAILISAIAFGIYHWFSYGVLGNSMAMIVVFIGTGLMGYAWAWAFSKTKSIMLPFGLHLGWNFTYNTIFSKGPLGELVLIPEGGSEMSDWASLLNFSVGLLIVPFLVLIFVKFAVRAEPKSR